MKQLFFVSGESHEIRAFRGQEIKSFVCSDAEEAERCAKALDGEGYNVFLTLNPVNKKSAKDEDVVERRFVLIDLDPEREAGSMATETQRGAAEEVCGHVREWLGERGVRDVSVCDSGNGRHLLVPVMMENCEESTRLVRDFLGVLAVFFDTEKVKIDRCVYNAARLTRFYGTTNRKGKDEDAWRKSGIIENRGWSEAAARENVGAIRRVVSEREGGERGQAERKVKYVCVELEKRGIEYRTERNGDGWKVLLRRCPWEGCHTTESREWESCVFVNGDGVVAFNCFHAHCSGRTWKDVLAIGEKRPERSEYPWGESSRSFLTLGGWIRSHSEVCYGGIMETGFVGVDRMLRGFLPGDVTILAGETSMGKTTFATSLSLNFLERGKRVAYFANESQSQVVNKFFLGASTESEREKGRYGWYVPGEKRSAVAERLESGLLLYSGTCDGQEIVNSLYSLGGVDVVVIDNLMSTALDEQGDIYVSQKLFCLAVKEAAVKMGFHGVVVAHTKKVEKGLPRIADIFGSSNIANVSDNIMIVHRGGPDFRGKMAAAKVTKGEVPVPLDRDAYLEVAKNKHFGEVGWCCMQYDAERGRIADDVRAEVDLSGIIRV